MAEIKRDDVIATVRDFIVTEVGFDGGSGMTMQAEHLVSTLEARFPELELG